MKELNLIFNDYISFLEKEGLEKGKLKEGYYWLDKCIVKAFDKNGNIHKILRIYIDDSLKITFKDYNYNFEIESWQETVVRNIARLKRIEIHSKALIKYYSKKFADRKIAILSSGGKDSSVTTYLVKEMIQNPQIIFNNTSLDCVDTYLHIKKEDNLTIINPKEGFYQWRNRLNFIPTRFSRACCSIFKEGAMINNLNKDDKYLFFMGMRNDESSNRSTYKDEWKNQKWGVREWNGILPIREWTEMDIWLYILWKNIDINTKYKKGYSRVGCAIACPFYTKSTWILDKYWYPYLYNRWNEILKKDFKNNKKATIMNCTEKEYCKCWNGGVYRSKPTEEVINEFAEQQNLNINIAKKYFNKTCLDCGKKIKKDDVALSMKYYGRNIENFKCIKCLSKDLNVTTKELKVKIQEFKDDGCVLF
ncbi:TPA: phosphoadenosine phosphosulfate reductase family protein [Clostridium botulinum]|nr:phosphoadenosine phosphosulfate reductase family protein [Clostridium botulinum]HBJ1652859.1 phosphoadenosine phosphosulfate reductase family protein [Clostridium botulinum]